MSNEIEKQSVYDSQYILQKKFSHPLQEEVLLMTNKKTFQRILCQEYLYSDNKQLRQAIQNVKKNIQLQNDFLLNILDYSCSKIKKLCSTQYLLRIFYEQPETDLYREMLKRRKNNQRFSGVFLTYLFYQQLLANQYLEQNGIHHGLVSPYNIALNRGTQKSYLIYTDIITIKNQQIYLQNQKKFMIKNLDLYQSPEVFELMFQNKQNNQLQIYDEETFSLGLILLQCGLNKSIQDIYDLKQKRFNHQKLQQYFDEFQNIYQNENQFLVTAVQHMINLDENPEKSNFTEILESCPPYSQIDNQLQRILNPQSQQFQQLNFYESNHSHINAQAVHEKDSQQQIKNFSSNNYENFQPHVKHEYIKGGKITEPKVIREDRTGYIPYPSQN